MNNFFSFLRSGQLGKVLAVEVQGFSHDRAEGEVLAVAARILTRSRWRRWSLQLVQLPCLLWRWWMLELLLLLWWLLTWSSRRLGWRRRHKRLFVETFRFLQEVATSFRRPLVELVPDWRMDLSGNCSQPVSIRCLLTQRWGCYQLLHLLMKLCGRSLPLLKFSDGLLMLPLLWRWRSSGCRGHNLQVGVVEFMGGDLGCRCNMISS